MRRTAQGVLRIAVGVSAVALLAVPVGVPKAAADDLPVSTAQGNKLSNGGEASLARTAASGDDVYVVWQDRTITGTGVSDIALRHSADRGATFGGVTNLSHAPFVDSRHPEVTASGDNVYVTWQQVAPQTQPTSREEIWFTASGDRSTSFGSPQRLDVGDASATDPIVTSDGSRVVVGWTASDGSVDVATSADGGHSFAAPVRIGSGQWEAARPALAVQGKHVVAVWATNTAAGIEGSSSDDGGATFSPAVQIAAGDRVAPAVAMDESGVAVAAWFARTENSNGTLETATSRDAGATWSAANKVAPILLAPIRIAESHGVFLLSASQTTGSGTGEAVWSAFDGGGFAQQAFYPGAKEADVAAAVAEPSDLPAARFAWSMPDRYGPDTNGDGIIDQPQTSDYLLPSKYHVDFDACRSTSSGTITKWTWTVDGVTQPAVTDCHFKYDFAKQGQYDVTLKVTDNSGRSAMISHQVPVRDLLVVSIGDSVASGEGNPEKPDPNHPTWTDQRCHRTTLAGPSQAALQLERSDPASSVTFLSLACSGASVLAPDTAHGGLLTPYDGQQPDFKGEPPLPPQVDQLRNLLRNPDGTYRHIDALLVSIGANDAHFSEVLKSCMVGSPCYSGSTKTDFDARIATLPDHYQQLDTALGGLVDPHNVFITEYFDPTQDSSGAWNLDCVLSPYSPVDRSEAKWASTYVVPSLNAQVQAAAQQYGWNYVAGQAAGFARHGYCSDDRWIVQVGESFNAEAKPDGAFHPNGPGHVFYGQQIAAAVKSAFARQAGSSGSGTADADSRGDLYVALYNNKGTVQTVPYAIGGSAVAAGPAVTVASGVSSAGGSLRVDASDRTAYAVWTDLTSPTPVNGSFESFGGRGAYPAPNLRAIRTEAVQNVDTPNVLIAGKSTTIRTQVDNDFPTAQNVDVRLHTTATASDGTTSEQTTDTQVRVGPGTSWVDLPPDKTITIPGHADTYSATVTLDPDHRITEAYEDDNTASFQDNVVTSRVFKVLYVPAGSTGSMGQCADVTATEQVSSAFITATYPVADGDSRQVASCESQVTVTSNAAGVDSALSQLDAMARSEGYDAAVGVVPAGWLHTASGTTASGVALVGSSAPSGVPGAGALVEAGNGGALTAHEVGHLFGLAHDAGVPAPGYWPSQHQPQDNTTDFMDPQIQPRTWIAKATSTALLQRLQLTPGDPAVIEIRGIIHPDGSVDAPAWYRQQGIQDVPLGSPGAVTLRYLDSGGHLLGTTGVDAQSTDAAGVLTDTSPTGGNQAFDVRVPDIAGAAELVLQRGSTVLVDRHISSSPPTVHLTAPADGATLSPGQHLTVTWTASDPDSATLSSQVEVSTDSGVTWVPLARDVAGTSYDMTVTRTLQGSHIRFRVITSDGINTASAANAADLSIAQATANGRIAFTHQNQYGGFPATYSGYEAWVMNADGSNQHKIFDGVAPRLWDPAGGSLVSLTGDSIQWYNVDTGAVRTVAATLPPGTYGPIAPCPVFSPDGTKLAFKANSLAAGIAIYTIGVDGNGLRLVADNVAGCPSWSPDGSHIAFAESTAPGNGIATVAPDGSNRTLIYPTNSGISDLAYSPDGQQLVYFSDYRAHLLNADGSGAHTVYPGAGGYTYQVGWSPDGSRLLVQWWNYGYTYMIATMKPDGSDLHALTNNDPNDPNTFRIDSWPSWESLNGSTPPPPAAHPADAGGPYTVAQGQPLTVDASRSAATGSVPLYEWDLDGNGTYGDATGVLATTVFRSPGHHSVGLRVTHPDGTTATAQADVTVSPVPPTVAAPNGINSAVGLPVDLVGATVTNYGITPPSVNVDWGDGTAATGATLGQLVDGRYNVVAQHTYASGGTYSIRLTATDDGTTGPATTIAATIDSDAGPRITGVSPATAPATGGAIVRIQGSRLSSTNRVTIGGTPATYQTLGDTAIDVSVPAVAIGADPIVVTTAGGATSTNLSAIATTAPTAANIAVETPAGVAAGIQLHGTGSGNWMTFTTTSVPSHGAVEIATPDTVTYSPNNGFIGTDTFQYVAYDANGTSRPATVTIRVGNHPPTVANATATGPVGTPLTVTQSALLAHASDADGDQLGVVGAYINPDANADFTFDAATGAVTVTRALPGVIPVDVLVSDRRGDPVHETLTVTFTANLPQVVGLNSLSVSANGASVDSLDSSPAAVVSNQAITVGGAKIQGDVTSTQGSVTLQPGTVVSGTVRAGTTITDRSGSKITSHPNAPSAPLTPHGVSTCGPYRAAPSASDPWITGKFSYNASTGSLSVSGHNSVTIEAGTYCLASIELTGQATLNVSSGPAVIHLIGQFNASGGALVNATKNAANLQIATSYAGANGVAITGGAAAYALVYAPGTGVTLSGGSALTGAVLGKSLVISGNSSVHSDSSQPALVAWANLVINGA